MLLFGIIPWPLVAAPIAFDFTNGSDAADWSKTAPLTATPSREGLKLTASDWDAKLSRYIELEPGRYVMYGRGSGNLRLLLLPDWGRPDICHLVLTSEKPGTDFVDFTIPPGSPQKAILCVWVDGKNTSAKLEWLRLESSPKVEADIQTINPDELAKYRPDPPIVRGFMVRSLESSDPKEFPIIASKWGANVIRLQVFPCQSATKRGKSLWEAWPDILEQLDQTVAAAQAAGLKVIVDMHGPPMPEFMNPWRVDQPEFWHHPDLEKNFVRVWTDIAKKLKPRASAIWGYDLYNEPLDRSQLPWAPKQWYPLAVKIVHAIREIDPAVWIVYEPGPGSMSRGFQGLVPLPDKRVIYSFHDYSPGEFTAQGLDYVGGLDQTDIGKVLNVHYPSKIKGIFYDKAAHLRELSIATEFQKKWNVPMFVGEFSVIRWAPKEDAVRWLQDTIDLFESLGWSYTYHAYREWNGWSLEHDETYCSNQLPAPDRVDYITDRGKVMMKAFEKNKLASNKENDIKTPLDESSALPHGKSSGKFRILYIGDSITDHGTNAEIAEKLGWDHAAGMAASEKSKDYVHLLAAAIRKDLPNTKVEIAILHGSGGGTVRGRLEVIEKARNYKPNLVVIQLGENEDQKDGAETLRSNYQKLLSAFDDQDPKPVVLAAGNWSPSGYQGWDGETQRIMGEECAKKQVAFVSVEDMAIDPHYRGWGTSSKVKWHPNDDAHAGYAERLHKAFLSILNKTDK